MNIQRSFFPYLALAALLFLLYSNTFTAPFVFDDNPNIIDNPPLQIDNLMPETIWHTFFAKPFEEGKLYRPVACLTLALNWYAGQSNPIGYHIVNIFIHYGTALFLFLTVLLLFRTPVLKNTYTEESRYFISLLTAVLWAINPIQAQAVTYIVQRMASLATLFFLIAIYCYLKGRFNASSRKKYFLLCIINFFLALGCKENAVLFPISLLLIEYTFFYSKGSPNNTFIRFLSIISLLLGAAGLIYLFRAGIFTGFFSPAGSRPFSYFERLITESRILFFYLSLIFYPIPSRLSIDHDFIVSTTIFQPWTTAISILGILSLSILSFRYIRKAPLISFAILFFFLNHLVESTVLPLELVFEHRNYLPSLFLFLPLVAGLDFLLTHYTKRNRFVMISIIAFTVLLIILVGIGTYIRNMSYASSNELWKDTLEKAPNSSRALSNLGLLAGWSKNHSLDTLQKALSLNFRASESILYRTTFKPAIVSNIGGIYFNYGYMEKAIEYFRKSIEINPTYINAHFNLSRAYLRMGEYQLALNEINLVIANAPPESRFFGTQGLILLWSGKPAEALQASRNSMSMLYKKDLAYYSIGCALSSSGSYKQAKWFLELAKQNERNNIRIALSALENSIRSRDPLWIQKDALYLFENFDMSSISDALKLLPADRRSAPVNVELIRPIITETAKKLSTSLFTQ